MVRWLYKKHGITLVETLIALVILVLVASIVSFTLLAGSKFLARDNSQWLVERELRKISSILTKELRNATNLDVVDEVGSPEQGYNYIYLDSNDNSLKQLEENGNVDIISTVTINSIAVNCNKVDNKNLLSITISGGAGDAVCTITFDVLLNNIQRKNPDTGLVIRYNNSHFIARPGDGKVTLTFPASTNVQILKSAESSLEGFVDTGISLSSNSTSATVPGLTNGVQYWFKLVVTGGERNGTYLVICTPEVPVNPISDLSATSGNGEVSLTFSAPTDATSVKLLKSVASSSEGFEDAGIDLNSSSTSSTVTGLTNGVQYWFKLLVEGGPKAGISNIVSSTPEALLDLSGVAVNVAKNVITGTTTDMEYNLNGGVDGSSGS